jgi:hypothetical protein
MMLCLNATSCQHENLCVFGLCICSNEYYLNKHDDTRYYTLVLPMIGAIIYDLPSLRNIYFLIIILLSSIGLINNIFSLMTFIRDRIRYTICGIYLITYSICSLVLMILILTNLMSAVYSDKYLFHLWTCHGYPYLSLIMVYTCILISTAIVIEGVLIKCFKYDKFRSRKQAIIISFVILLMVSLSNLDKIFGRYLTINQSGSISCKYKSSLYRFWSKLVFNIYIMIPCLIHLICICLILIKENHIRKIYFHKIYFIPSLFIILCLFSNGLYRYLFHYCFIYTSGYTIRLHVGWIFLLYAPQILTYVIYVIPNDFYVKEFYQIWFYRKLCCCFYNRRRHIQEFEVIHRLWQRRTSLETIKTISNLDDNCIDSEFYKTIKMEF